MALVFARHWSIATASLAVAAVAGCAATTGERDGGAELLTRSYFRAELFDGNCLAGAARPGQRLQDYSKRIDATGPADLDCVLRALPDASPLRNQPAAYYYYQTYLLIRSNGGDLSSVALDDLLARTGLLDAPLSGQTLYALATLFGVKGHDACDRDLAEQASRTGELKFASEVNEAQRRISSEGLPQTCTHPAALEIIRRVADSNVRGDQAFHSYAHCEHAFPEPCLISASRHPRDAHPEDRHA